MYAIGLLLLNGMICNGGGDAKLGGLEGAIELSVVSGISSIDIFSDICAWNRAISIGPNSNSGKFSASIC